MTTVLLGVGMFTGTIPSPAAAAPVAVVGHDGRARVERPAAILSPAAVPVVAGLTVIGFMAFAGVQL